MKDEEPSWWYNKNETKVGDLDVPERDEEKPWGGLIIRFERPSQVKYKHEGSGKSCFPSQAYQPLPQARDAMRPPNADTLYTRHPQYLYRDGHEVLGKLPTLIPTSLIPKYQGRAPMLAFPMPVGLSLTMKPCSEPSWAQMERGRSDRARNTMG